MVRLIIIRHGYSMGNKENRFSGQADVPLDEVGISQAASTAKYVLENYRVDSVYSSDLSRAVNTVKPIADALGLPVHTCKDLREMKAKPSLSALTRYCAHIANSMDKYADGKNAGDPPCSQLLRDGGKLRKWSRRIFADRLHRSPCRHNCKRGCKLNGSPKITGRIFIRPGFS